MTGRQAGIAVGRRSRLGWRLRVKCVLFLPLSKKKINLRNDVLACTHMHKPVDAAMYKFTGIVILRKFLCIFADKDLRDYLCLSRFPLI